MNKIINSYKWHTPTVAFKKPKIWIADRSIELYAEYHSFSESTFKSFCSEFKSVKYSLIIFNVLKYANNKIR